MSFSYLGEKRGHIIVWFSEIRLLFFSSAYVSANTSVGQFSILSFTWLYKILNPQKKELLKKILALKLVPTFLSFTKKMPKNHWPMDCSTRIY